MNEVNEETDTSTSYNSTTKIIYKSNKNNKKQIWNIVAEVLKREQGFFKQQNESFHKKCYSSCFIIERMQLSHHLTKLTRGDIPIINFNSTGDLICAGCNYNNNSGQNNQSVIKLIDWAHKKVEAEIVIANLQQQQQAQTISDVNFLKGEFYKNELNIFSVYENGLLRHDVIRPTDASKVLMQQCQLTGEGGSPDHYKLAISSDRNNNGHEILIAASNGNIFGLDIRCGGVLETTTTTMKTPTLLAQTKPVGKFVKLHAISHHPLAPQICASYSDFNVRVFDKRKFDRPLHEICPRHLTQTNSFANFSDCIYSYDGSEILTIYHGEKIYLFDGENRSSGEFKKSFNQAGLVGYDNNISFFGTKSEYILIGNDAQCIGFLNKIDGKCENHIILRANTPYGSTDYLALKSHPHLPIVAASVQGRGLSILSPSSKNKNIFLDE